MQVCVKTHLYTGLLTGADVLILRGAHPPKGMLDTADKPVIVFTRLLNYIYALV